MQFQQTLVVDRQCGLGDDLVFGPFHGLVDIVEYFGRMPGSYQSQLIEILLDVLAAGQVFGKLTEDQHTMTFTENIFHLIQDMRRGNIHRLYPPHVEDQVFAGLQVGFQGVIQLTGGAEEQAALQLHDGGLRTVS